MKKKIIISMITIMGLILSFSKVKADTYQTFNVYGQFSNNVATCQGYGSPYNCTRADITNGFYKIHSAFDYNQSTQEWVSKFKQYLVYFDTTGTIVQTPTGASSVDMAIKLTIPNGITTYYVSNDITSSQTFTQSQEEGIGFVVETFSHNLTIGICQLKSSIDDIYYLNCPVSSDIQFVRFRFYYTSVPYGLIDQASVGFDWGYKDAWSWVIDSSQTITNAIDNQTNEIINQNATYQDTPYEETNGTDEVNEYNDLEDSIMNSLNFDINETQQITFNPQASLWIWSIAERLRGINPAIVLLMTSILGIGIIKMVLNR